MSSYGMSGGTSGPGAGGGGGGLAALPSISSDGGGGAMSMGGSGGGAAASVDPAAQMRAFTAHLSVLADPGQKDEAKLKSAQELSDNLDLILASPLYQQFLSNAMTVFIKLLQEGRPHFIAEYNVQQVLCSDQAISLKVVKA